VLEPLIEAAVAPLRAELADTRGALETARQELGAALERLRALETDDIGEDAPDAYAADQEPVWPPEADSEAIEPDRRPQRPWWRFWARQPA
jgi:hypothetical protein